MQVKRFVAADMRRALEMVRQEMGPDAIILSTQRTGEGVEIITSLESDLSTRGVDERREFSHKFASDVDRPLSSDQAWENQAGLERAVEQFGARPVNTENNRGGEAIAREIERARERMLAARQQAEQGVRVQTAGERYGIAPAEQLERRGGGFAHTQEQRLSQAIHHAADNRREEQADRRLDALQSELADMRLLLEQQLWRMKEQDAGAAVTTPPVRSLLQQHLERLGLTPDLVQTLSRQARPNQRPSQAWREVLARLARQLPTTGGDLINRGGVFAFVGPTGVGKTTTIAKLAARYVLEHGRGKVALVTTDTYRVGAHDQLRSLGRILNMPVRVVDRERNIATVLANLKHFPLVLIDTAGFRQGDPLLKEQMRMLDACPAVEKVLVIAGNSQLQSLKASTHAYTSPQLSACVLTKLDETASLGEALSVVLKRGLPVAYTTDGQEIPKDIAAASGHTLVAKAVALLKSQGRDNMGKAL